MKNRILTVLRYICMVVCLLAGFAATASAETPVTGIHTAGKVVVAVGEKTVWKASVVPAGATNKSLYWWAGNPGVATVDQNGVITAHRAGQCHISVTANNGVRKVVMLTVRDTSVTGIQTAGKTVIDVGETTRWTASVLPSGAANKSLYWWAGNPGVATVDQNGVITAHKAGQCHISVTADNGVRKVVMLTVKASSPTSLSVAGKSYTLGMSVQNLTALAGNPVRILPSREWQWYVFGTETYLDFLLAGVSDGKVVALASCGKAFSYFGCSAGAKITSDIKKNAYSGTYWYTDSNDGDILHAVLLRSRQEDPNFNRYTEETLLGESVVNFHMTNAFRVYHGKSILAWSDAAARAARLHSIDMGENQYFSHVSKDGRTLAQRLSNIGISWSSCGENICAGYSDGISAYDGWVNSSGHRTNMLRDYFRHLGVGAGYFKEGGFGLYMTQDFFR